jgi:hypothetical protein
MRRLNDSRIFVLFAASLWLIAGGASAQVNPEVGDVGAQGQASGRVETQGTWQPGTPNQPPPAAETELDTPAENRFGTTDHGKVVGRFGVGFFGVASVPIGGGTVAAPDVDDSVDAPTIGLRYWLWDWMAIEGALGLGITSSGASFESGNTSADNNGPSAFALALHGGVPLALAASQHFVFEVIPELNFGFATGGIDDESMANNDIDTSGFLFEIGARVGAEIHFGFIDIPELSLQGTVGLHLRYEGRGVSAGDSDASISSFRFGTNVQGEPWDIFTGSIAAIYYF